MVPKLEDIGQHQHVDVGSGVDLFTKMDILLEQEEETMLVYDKIISN